jgi:cytoskeletal protein RodZ
MKVCPECNDTFPDEMKFCDLDGTKLNREAGQEGLDQSRLWSLIGVGVLLGAIVIIAISVLFSPRTPDAPALARTTPQTSNPSPAETAAAPQSDIVVEEPLPAETKKKEKPVEAANSNSAPAPNIKAAARDSDAEGDAFKSAPGAASAKSASTDAEAPAVKAKGEDTETTSKKPAATDADPKSDKKNAKDSDKNSNGKKPEEKKKGGLFRIFKKIFGKG